ncbi:MAG: hypothetical protein ACNS63_02290 [Candidatus Nitrospinota bacterium M3_3B_026]
MVIYFVFSISPVDSLAKTITYPVNQVARPLTLPAGVWELGAGASISEWNNDGGSAVYPAFSIRYGLTSDIELYLLGVKYRPLTESRPLELVMKARIAGIGESNVKGSIVLTEAAIETKTRITPSISLHCQAEEYHGFYSNGEDVSDLRLSIGQTVSFTDKFSIGIMATYRRLAGFDAEDAGFASGAIRYNFSPRFDVVFEGSAGDFDDSEDMRREMKSSRHEYGISLNWRF